MTGVAVSDTWFEFMLLALPISVVMTVRVAASDAAGRPKRLLAVVTWASLPPILFVIVTWVRSIRVIELNDRQPVLGTNQIVHDLVRVKIQQCRADQVVALCVSWTAHPDKAAAQTKIRR